MFRATVVESYGKFWTNVMSTRVRVGEEEKELSKSEEMVSEGRTSYYSYSPGQQHSDLVENYTDFISILEHNDDDEVEIIDKKQIKENSEAAHSNMKDNNQVRSVTRYFSLYF